jgi:hypothetical protein
LDLFTDPSGFRSCGSRAVANARPAATGLT